MAPLTPAPILGLEPITLPFTPLGSSSPGLWQVLCLGAQAVDPRPVLRHQDRDRCEQFMASSVIEAWRCSACQAPYGRHVRLWTEGVPLEEAFRAHRAMQLTQEATLAPERPPVNPEELEARSTEPAPVEEQVNAKPPRGPHADRLEQARAAHQAAIQPKPKRSPPPSRPRPSRDPFEEEDA